MKTKITAKLLKDTAKKLDIDMDFNDFDFDNYWYSLDRIISEVTDNLGFTICGTGGGDSYIECVCYSFTQYKKTFQWNVVLDNDVGHIENWKELAEKINFFVAEAERVASRLV